MNIEKPREKWKYKVSTFVPRYLQRGNEGVNNGQATGKCINGALEFWCKTAACPDSELLAAFVSTRVARAWSNEKQAAGIPAWPVEGPRCHRYRDVTFVSRSDTKRFPDTWYPAGPRVSPAFPRFPSFHALVTRVWLRSLHHCCVFAVAFLDIDPQSQRSSIVFNAKRWYFNPSFNLCTRFIHHEVSFSSQY